MRGFCSLSLSVAVSRLLLQAVLLAGVLLRKSYAKCYTLTPRELFCVVPAVLLQYVAALDARGGEDWGDV
jgi:hypothetical protein